MSGAARSTASRGRLRCSNVSLSVGTVNHEIRGTRHTGDLAVRMRVLVTVEPDTAAGNPPAPVAADPRLFAVLLVHGGEVVSVDRRGDVLWVVTCSRRTPVPLTPAA